MDILGILIFFSLLGSFVRLVYDSYFYTIDKYFYIKRIIQMKIKSRQEKQLKEYHPDFETFYDTVIYLKDEEVYRKIKTLKTKSIQECIKFINEKLSTEKQYIIDCVLNIILTSNNNIQIEEYYYNILRPFMFCYELDLEYTKKKIDTASYDLQNKINSDMWKFTKDTRYELTLWICNMIISKIILSNNLEKYLDENKKLLEENMILKNRLENDNYIQKIKKYISRS
jgi:hypothetical protein